MYLFGWYIPQFYESTTTYLWAEAFYIGVAAMGLNLLTGYNGQVSIGHGAFFGLGMYTTAILMESHDWPFLPTVFVAAAITFVVGVLVGLPGPAGQGPVSRPGDARSGGALPAVDEPIRASRPVPDVRHVAGR